MQFLLYLFCELWAYLLKKNTVTKKLCLAHIFVDLETFKKAFLDFIWKFFLHAFPYHLVKDKTMLPISDMYDHSIDEDTLIWR